MWWQHPGLIPRKPSDRVKTDRRDARTLALALRAGQLTGIYIPTAQDESVRDYLRMYEDLRGDLRICKQRVLHFLLRRGIRYDQGSPWTVKHKNWLSSLEFSDSMDRKTLDMYLSTIQELEGKCSEAAEEMEQIATQDRYCEQTKKLAAFKGIKTLIALSFVADIGDFRALSVAKEASPRPAIAICDGFWWRRPGTTAATIPAVAPSPNGARAWLQTSSPTSTAPAAA